MRKVATLSGAWPALIKGFRQHGQHIGDFPCHLGGAAGGIQRQGVRPDQVQTFPHGLIRQFVNLDAEGGPVRELV